VKLLLAVNKFLLRFEIFTGMAMKNGIFWNVMTCGS
jgi:hypothetical protein